MGVELIIRAVGVNPIFNTAILILQETNGPRCLLMYIGQLEAMALVVAKATTPRPTTHDLMLEAITSLGGRVTKVLINHCEQETFYAQLVLDVGGRHIEFDCRPSDAIVLAVKVDVPIFAEEHLFEEYAAHLSIEELGEGSNKKGITREQLGPFREIL